MTDPSTVLPLSTAPRHRVAVLLNANARSVGERLRRELERHVPAEDVYYSRSMADARAVVQLVIAKGYDTVLTGGGDGTFVGVVNEMILAEGPRVSVVSAGGAAAQVQTVRRLPRFGVLRLGTGNALAGVFGASKGRLGVIEDVLRVRSGDVGEGRRLQLIDADGKRSPFAGLGIDAKILNDYNALHRTFRQTPLSPLASGPAGYFLSITGRSIPHFLLAQRPANLRVINEGAPVQQVGPSGEPVGPPLPTGAVLYEGPCRVAAAGTVPSYGFGFTVFPHAFRQPGRMQLRLTALSVPRLIAAVPKVWKGVTPPTGLLDLLCERVRLQFDRPMPFQVGGDAEGYREEVVLAVDPTPIDMIDFRPDVVTAR